MTDSKVGVLVKGATKAAVAAGAAWAVRALVARLLHFLDKDEQLLVVQLTDTVVLNGPGVRIVSPFVKDVTKRKAELLEPLDFVRIKDSLTGEVTVEVGPKLHFLNAFDVVQERGRGHSLSPTEYCIVQEMRS